MKFLLFASALAGLITGSADWPAFKGASAIGVADGPAPTTWNIESSTNIRWKAAIPGVGHSSPIVWGNRVFVTTAVADGAIEYPSTLTDDMRPADDSHAYSWQVLCLDATRGTIVWRRTLHTGIPRSQRHSLNSFATPTPVTDGKHLVVYFGSEGLYCLDMNGNVRWRRDLGVLKTGFYQDPSLQWGAANSPVLYRNLVLIQADTDDHAFLAAYDLETSNRIWTTPRNDGQSWSTPTVYEGAPYDTVITNAPRHVRGYDPLTGKERWRLRWDLDIVLSTPTVANGLIFTASGKGDTQPIVAIRPAARGEITPADPKTSNQWVLWSTKRGGAIITSPLVYGEWLYTLIDLGILKCFSARTGEVQYQQRIDDGFFSSPVAADGKVFLTSQTGRVYVVKAGPTYELVAVNDMDEPCMATPAISNGTMFIRTLHHLYAIDDRSTPTTDVKHEPR